MGYNCTKRLNKAISNYAFTRTWKHERLLVILNFSADPPVFALPSHIRFTSSELLIGNYPVDAGEDLRLLTLRPYEARVYRLPATG